MTEAAGTSRGTTAVRRNVTIYDVASVAGVSHQSVSRYMRGMDMRASTRAKIEKALETLDYRPNLAARALIMGRTTRIGALTHETNQFGPNLIIQGATSAAREAGYLLDVVTLDMGDVDELNRALDLLLQYDLSGILAFASTDSVLEVFEQTDFGVPVVIAAEDEDLEVAAHPESPGIGALVSHLVSLGHEEFLHIAGPRTWSAARNRIRAVEAALAFHGLEPAAVVHGDWSARSGYDAVLELSASAIPSAIVAANDQMALGAIHALAQRGLRVPEDVSVTGVDDTPESAFFTPALTTVRMDFQAQGRNDLATLLDMIDPTRTDEAPGIPVPQLCIRESTAPRSPHHGR